jgi:histidinol-phosphate aminotransferase
MTPATGLPPLRADLGLGGGYHSPQVPAEVRLNTNESPYPPPSAWVEAYRAALADVAFHRYPDRDAAELRAGLAELHGVGADEIFCANGSNEVLQCLLLAYGGPGRRAAMFEPTYALHRHISRVSGTEVVSASRGEDFLVEPATADALLGRAAPTITFVCSPNNPTGRAEAPGLVDHLLARAPGLVVVDEAYGQFADWSALDRRAAGAGIGSGTDDGAVRRLVVVRTFSKTWALAAARLGYLVADPAVVAACSETALPYHLSAPAQVAGTLALRFRAEMEERVARVATERERLARGLAALAVQTWPSDANFILFRPLTRDARAVWQHLLDQSVLVRDCSSWDGLEGCLRVTVGTPGENDRFLEALDRSLT